MSVTQQAEPVLRLVMTEEERALRETVFSLTAAFGPAYYEKANREKRSPVELWSALADGGFLGVHLPEEYGGGGMGLQELTAVLEETGAAGVPLLGLLVSPGIIGTILSRHGTQEQKDKWLRRIADGSMKFSFGLTEPNAGSNSHNLETTAVRQGDTYVVNGQKYYISGVDECDLICLVVRTGRSANGRGELTLLMVDPNAPGLTRQPIETVLEEPEKQFTLFFDNVEVPAENRVGEEGKGLRVAFDGLNPERILSAAVSLGVARYALDKATKYARDRKVWSTPIGAHQAIAHPLAEAKVKYDLARFAMQRAAALYDAGLDAGEASNIAKLAAAEAGVFCLDRAIQTHGGNGVAREYQLANYWFLARLQLIAPVSREMILNFISEHTLNLPRSY
ncbi:acyl-CoA dehydrogenase family protein [Streptomyces sp. GQFP]|uniref:acyl-CoA dehydrogenase family protein n=1 Tax=Streptomyces sp. GQFP TaxID=2907545 RepID=UPI001F2D14A1|nr:acyl-CoA dehydrogenase family protein [Streptomyces sp. GQFP]UIX31977.1 acyl-CoA/acyl-ACP dehydrogenase [Streptomyces sp. GQFP]